MRTFREATKYSMVIEGKPPLTLHRRVKNLGLKLQRDTRISAINKQVRKQTDPDPKEQPIVFFNPSTRLSGFSQNAAFGLLACWGLQIANQIVVHFTCQGGMSRCVLGSDPDHFLREPPCRRCVNQSRRLQASTPVHWFTYNINSTLNNVLERLSLDELHHFRWQVNSPGQILHGQILPLGEIVLPSLRWALRRHHLQDNETTLSFYKAYIQSACQVAVSFDQFISKYDPKVVVVFNGIMYPEATARWVAMSHGIRVITHEVGFQPFSVFFSGGQATAYPMNIPESFELSQEDNQRLDSYLSKRFKGEFTMAGIKFWPAMSGLSDALLSKVNHFKQVVPVFTNVINDTSQIHASTVFSHMFDWLEHVLLVIEEHKDTLFVIRAHPDEKRRGTKKHSREPVSDWIIKNGVDQMNNVIFVDSNESLSSYDLIRKSKLVIVYNSSIGLEAALLGVPVLCGGKARYTQYPTVFFPQTPEKFLKMAKEFLDTSTINIPESFQKNARRVLFWQLYRKSIPLGRYLSPHPTPGYVQLKKFSWQDLSVENSPSMDVLVDGIVNGKPFLYYE